MPRKVGEEKKFSVEARFGRLMSNRDEDEDTMRLTLECKTSGIEFAEIEMSMADFGKLVGGCCDVRLQAELRGLEYIGKKYISERRSVWCPLKDTYKKEPLEVWLVENCQEPGWIINTYLGSQSSVESEYGTEGCTIHYSVFKYVDVVP